MAGQARHVPRAGGRSRAGSSSPVVETAAAAAPGPSFAPGGSPGTDPESGSTLVTRTTYRSLLIRGLTPTEAADLTAWLAGIPAGAAHWKLTELNRLLFLRSLHEGGRFGPTDGGPADLH